MDAVVKRKTSVSTGNRTPIDKVTENMCDVTSVLLSMI
jgi:hypothetical protein